MSDQTERETFIRAVCAAPDDDLPRLVFADWLDERSDPLGEFVRVQCELARLIGDGSRCAVCDWPIRSGGGCEPDNCSFRPREGSGEHARWLPRQQYFHALRRRERELWDAGRAYWGRFDGTGPLQDAVNLLDWWRRGFVESVTTTAAQWLYWAAAIRAATPLRKVVLTTWPDIMSLYSLSAKHGFGDSPGNRIERHQEILAAEFPGIEFVLPHRFEPDIVMRERIRRIAVPAPPPLTLGPAPPATPAARSGR